VKKEKRAFLREFLEATPRELFITDKWSGSLELVCEGENPIPIGRLA